MVEIVSRTTTVDLDSSGQPVTTHHYAVRDSADRVFKVLEHEIALTPVTDKFILGKISSISQGEYLEFPLGTVVRSKDRKRTFVRARDNFYLEILDNADTATSTTHTHTVDALPYYAIVEFFPVSAEEAAKNEVP